MIDHLQCTEVTGVHALAAESAASQVVDVAAEYTLGLSFRSSYLLHFNADRVVRTGGLSKCTGGAFQFAVLVLYQV